MASVPQELIDALAKINTETDNLAVVVTALRDAIKTSMTQADVDSVKTSLSDVATRLSGIAADPNAPVPPGPTPQFRKRP